MSGYTSLSNTLRGYYISRIMSFRDEPDTGDFYAEYYLIPLLDLHGGTLEHLSDAELHVEYSRAPVISGFLYMGLINGHRFWRVAEMSLEQLASYRAYCAEACTQLAAADLNDPPKWLAWMNL